MTRARRRSSSRSGGSTVPCANYDTRRPSCYEDHLITVPSGAGIDNAKATFRIEFTPASDWDMKVYKADADGNATGDAVASSGHGATDGDLGLRGGARCSTRSGRTWSA